MSANCLVEDKSLVSSTIIRSSITSDLCRHLYLGDDNHTKIHMHMHIMEIELKS